MLVMSSKVAALVTAGTLIVAAGCSSSNIAAPSPVTPRYHEAGPDSVGVTTLDLGSAGPTLGERSATVFYPTDAASLSGHAPFTYTEASTLPVALQGILPAKYNITTTVSAYLEPPASKRGPYPVVLFSHGYGGERLYYSHLLAGIASWGYVVVSADYLERGLAAQALKLTTRPSTAQDSAIMRSSLIAVEQASGDPASPLSGVVDPKRVATVGHSAGGGTAFNALDSPSVKTAVGWAPVPPTGTPSSKPVMLIGTEGDSVVTPSTVTKAYKAFGGPKVLVEISGEGHNSYTDICSGIRSGGGLISYAISAGFVQTKLAKLGINGCQPGNIDPVRFWPIVQYYTVLQLENQLNPHAFGSIPTPSPTQFPGFTVTITQAG
jgi:dienelactone hydrolase